MGILRQIDKQLWLVPIAGFLLVGAGLGSWTAASSQPVLLAAATVTARQSMYSSLTGSSSALLGLVVAAIAILVAFPVRTTNDGRTSTQREGQLARARTILIGSLLSASCFLLLLLMTATVAIGLDTRPRGNSAIITVIEASCLASMLGLVVGGLGLTLVIVERSRQ